MEPLTHVLLASVVVVFSSRLSVQIACILNGNLVSRLGIVFAVAFLDDLLIDAHYARPFGVTAKSGCKKWCGCSVQVQSRCFVELRVQMVPGESLEPESGRIWYMCFESDSLGLARAGKSWQEQINWG